MQCLTKNQVLVFNEKNGISLSRLGIIIKCPHHTPLYDAKYGTKLDWHVSNLARLSAAWRLAFTCLARKRFCHRPNISEWNLSDPLHWELVSFRYFYLDLLSLTRGRETTVLLLFCGWCFVLSTCFWSVSIHPFTSTAIFLRRFPSTCIFPFFVSSFLFSISFQRYSPTPMKAISTFQSIENDPLSSYGELSSPVEVWNRLDLISYRKDVPSRSIQDYCEPAAMNATTGRDMAS